MRYSHVLVTEKVLPWLVKCVFQLLLQHVEEHTHTHIHTNWGSLINVSLPSSVSRPLLIHLSCRSSVHCFHTPALHLSNHHLPVIHLIPLSLHATSSYQSSTFTAKRKAAVLTAGSVNTMLWHFPLGVTAAEKSSTKSRTIERTAPVPDTVVWRQEVSARRPKLLYGWKERDKKQTPTFSSSTGQSLKGQTGYLLPSEVFSSPWKDSSPYWQSSEFACSCLRASSPLVLEWNLEVTQQWPADPPLCPHPRCNNASCQSRWLTSSWLHHCPSNGPPGTSRSSK